MRWLGVCALLSGCTPFIRADVGYSQNDGDYYVYGNDRPIVVPTEGAIFSGEIGLRQYTDWGNGYCLARHISFLVNDPEIALNMVNCGLEVEFGGK